MKVINHSKNSDYNKQRNNEILPIETCGPTSMAMALLQAGYRDWTKKNEDPADTITKALTTDEAYEKMYEQLNTKDTKWEPFNIHAILTWGVNKMIGKKVSTFKTNWDLKEIMFNVLNGGAAVLSGDFTLDNGRELGHIVSMAGFATEQEDIEEIKEATEIDLRKVPYFIIDDPYGDYTKNYKDHKGMNIEFKYDLFYDVFRKSGSFERKWAHLIEKA